MAALLSPARSEHALGTPRSRQVKLAVGVIAAIATGIVVTGGPLAATADAAAPNAGATASQSASADAVSQLRIEFSDTGNNTLIVTNPSNEALQITLVLGHREANGWITAAGSEPAGIIPAGVRDYLVTIPAAAHGRPDGLYGIQLRFTGTLGTATVVLTDAGAGLGGLENGMKPVPEESLAPSFITVPDQTQDPQPTKPDETVTPPETVAPDVPGTTTPTTTEHPHRHGTAGAHATQVRHNQPASQNHAAKNTPAAKVLPNTGSPVGTLPLALAGATLVTAGGALLANSRRNRSAVVQD